MDRSDRVMGIDPSLTGFAMVIMGDDCYERKEISTTSSKWGKTVRGRIARYRHLLGGCLEFAKKHDVSQYFIEGYSFASRGQAVVSLGEFGGVLRDRLLWRNNVVVEISPTMNRHCSNERLCAPSPYQLLDVLSPSHPVLRRLH